MNVACGLDALPARCMPTRAALATRVRHAGRRARARRAAAAGCVPGRGLGSSGMTDVVVDAVDGRILGCIVLLDMDLLGTHTANSWAYTTRKTCLSAGPVSH